MILELDSLETSSSKDRTGTDRTVRVSREQWSLKQNPLLLYLFVLQSWWSEMNLLLLLLFLITFCFSLLSMKNVVSLREREKNSVWDQERERNSIYKRGREEEDTLWVIFFFSSPWISIENKKCNFFGGLFIFLSFLRKIHSCLVCKTNTKSSSSSSLKEIFFSSLKSGSERRDSMRKMWMNQRESIEKCYSWMEYTSISSPTTKTTVNIYLQRICFFRETRF